MSDDVPPVEHFRRFAEYAVPKLPLYRRLATGVAADPEVADRLLLADPRQRRPTLLFAAVHDVLLADGNDPLAAWYPSIAEDPRPVGDGADDPWRDFRRVAMSDAVAERVADRSTQTNEVARCSTVALALAGMADQPLGLVEVGASAGLNLLLDQYGYDYAMPDGSHRVVGQEAALVLPCEVRGLVEPPITRRPDIRSRIGLDLAPVDVSDPVAARWLLACQWPDQPERIARLRAALSIAATAPPPVVPGDAVGRVAELVAAVPADALPVVITTWVMCYLSVEQQRAFVAELDRAGAQRDLSYVFAEQPDDVPGLPIPTHPDSADPFVTVLVRLDWRAGVRTGRRLAEQHPHGTWVRWLADSPYAP